jgi:hypothetical protein
MATKASSVSWNSFACPPPPRPTPPPHHDHDHDHDPAPSTQHAHQRRRDGPGLPRAEPPRRLPAAPGAACSCDAAHPQSSSEPAMGSHAAPLAPSPTHPQPPSTIRPAGPRRLARAGGPGRSRRRVAPRAPTRARSPHWGRCATPPQQHPPRAPVAMIHGRHPPPPHPTHPTPPHPTHPTPPHPPHPPTPSGDPRWHIPPTTTP